MKSLHYARSIMVSMRINFLFEKREKSQEFFKLNEFCIWPSDWSYRTLKSDEVFYNHDQTRFRSSAVSNNRVFRS